MNSHWLQAQPMTELQAPTPRWYTDIIVEQLTLTFSLDNDTTTSMATRQDITLSASLRDSGKKGSLLPSPSHA